MQEYRDKINHQIPEKKGIDMNVPKPKKAMAVRPAMMMVPPPVYELFETLACAHPSRKRERHLRDATKDTDRHTKTAPNPNPAKTPTLVPTLC